MATSGTTTFESGFYIDDIITEAYERLGRFDYSGNDIKTARRSLNIMFQEWGNRGLHFWEVKNNSITLVQDQTDLYNVSINMLMVLQMLQQFMVSMIF
jgi:hypothetical protein